MSSALEEVRIGISHLLGKLGGNNLSTQRNVQPACLDGFNLHPGHELV